MVNDYDTTWFDPQGAEKRDNHIPYHASKEVITQNEVLASEIDTYFGAIDYHDIFSNTLQRERITITYYYQGNNWFAS
jgi:hypothetical protein